MSEIGSESDATIQIRNNGPLIVKGNVQLQDHDGRPVSHQEPVIALCRCGHSATKPYCDGAHKQAGFEG